MATSVNEELEGELELLRAMCSEQELKIDQVGTSTSLVVKLSPMTGGDEEKQFLWCELHVHIGPDYPSQPPSLALGSSRGLSDLSRSSLLTELERRAEELSGEPAVLFALTEAGREALTALNKPEGECAICLGSISEEEVSEDLILRLPCYHVFHRQCVIEYCQRELSRHDASTTAAADLSMLCPECRAEIPWTGYQEMQSVLAQRVSQSLESENAAADENYEYQEVYVRDYEPTSRQSDKLLAESAALRPEAFIRLHHLYQGSDEKEKPLLRLMKELGLDAVVYYGKPALLHIQGDPKDVDAFAGTAKRRHITVTIDVAQRSEGPAIASGITNVAAKKGSLDSATFKEHLMKRCLGETAFTIIGN